jgi:penicillin-binding protein 2
MFGNKGIILYILTIISGIIFLLRLFYLQVIDNTYRNNPLNNSSVTAKYDYPNRGFIYDRNGELMVNNLISYDIMVVPNDVKEIDTISFCELLKIDKDYFIKKMQKSFKYSPRKPSIFLDQLSKEDFAALQEKMFQFKGFYIQKRMLRMYPNPTSANILGYISQANEALIEKNPYYQMGELVGTQGVEKQYEEELRGIKGVKFVNKNIHNIEVGSYKNGAFDTIAVPGKDLTLSIDLELQQLGEWLLANKRGGIVAIEPSSGEILALVSAPSYDPNIMVGRSRSENFNKMYLDQFDKPLFDRSLQAQYPPGSTFKIVGALTALHLGSMTEETTTQCYGGYKYGSGASAFMSCHCGTHGKPISIREGIFRSCNTYFSISYKRSLEKFTNPQVGLNKWSETIKKFGLGEFLGVDLPIGQKGLIPTSDYYNHYYPQKNWRASTTISNAIGQGEILSTPIQLANMVATVANRGYYITPHVVKLIDKRPITNPKYTTKKNTGINPLLFEPVIDGMEMVFSTPGGTAFWSQLKGVQICGKTGTAENFIKVNGKKIQLEDHSIFIAFAPKYNPKIAIAVFVENGGFGSRIAAPISSLMIDKYLNDSIQNPAKAEAIHNIDLYKEQYNYHKSLLNINGTTNK